MSDIESYSVSQQRFLRECYELEHLAERIFMELLKTKHRNTHLGAVIDDAVNCATSIKRACIRSIRDEKHLVDGTNRE